MADKTPEAKPQVDATPDLAERICIKVCDGVEGNELLCIMKKTTQLQKLMDAYCTRMGARKGFFRFLFEGHRIPGEDTPDSLGMQELDYLDAFSPSDGR